MKHLYLPKAFLSVLVLIAILLFFNYIAINKILGLGIVTLLESCFVISFWAMNFWLVQKFSHKLFSKQFDDSEQYDNSKLIQAIRSYSHDYHNQLQVIRTLAQLNKYHEIIKYIDDYVATNDKAKWVQINNIAVTALFIVYETEARNKGIKLTIDSDIDFSKFEYSPTKINRILGNIIRNAIEILEQIKTEKREIQITLWETAENYMVNIWNNGLPIPQDCCDKIFTAGFSTKKSSGLGLSIVKELLDELHGEIAVASSWETGTEFKITLPRKRSMAG